MREALEQKRWDEVNKAAAQTGAVIEKAAEQVRTAAKLLGGKLDGATASDPFAARNLRERSGGRSRRGSVSAAQGQACGRAHSASRERCAEAQTPSERGDGYGATPPPRMRS